MRGWLTVQGRDPEFSATKEVRWIKIHMKLLLIHHSQLRAQPKLLTLGSERCGCGVNNLRTQKAEAGGSLYVQGHLGLCSKRSTV